MEAAHALSPSKVNKKGWTLQDIPWGQFKADRVDPEILKLVKAASLVEYNARDYATYLSNIFCDDPEFREAIEQWHKEEVQHGEVLGRWAEMADPTFNFQESFRRFTAGYKIDINAKESIRGSRSGELIARCIVETGTSSYYTALAESCHEPVLKNICQCIAGDELRHYKLFYTYLKKYLDKEHLNTFERVKIGLSRIQESEDDELAYAYFSANADRLPRNTYAANDNADTSYDRRKFSTEYAARAYHFYRAHHVRKVVTMVFKACGLDTQGWLARTASKIAWAGVMINRYNARKRAQLAA
jgi:rubrerythrin